MRSIAMSALAPRRRLKDGELQAGTFGRRPGRALWWLVTSSIPLYALGARTKYAYLLLAIFAGVAFLLGRRLPKPHVPHRVAALSLPMALWLLEQRSLRTLVGVAAVSSFVTAAHRARWSRSDLASATVISISAYLNISVFCYFVLGLHAPALANRERISGNSLGLFPQRIDFPFSKTWAATAYIAAGFIVAATPLLRSRDWRVKSVAFGGLPAAVVALIATNGRLALVTTLLLSIVFVLAPRTVVRSAVPLVGAAMLLPMWWGPVTGPISRHVEPLVASVPFLVRSDTEDVQKLYGRTIVWHGVHRAISEGDLLHQLFGWGKDGQVESGASSYYANRFDRAVLKPERVPAHNSILQQWLDSGLLGAVYLLLLTLAATRRLQQSLASATSPWGLAALSVLVVVALGSGSEVILAVSQEHETLLVFLLIVAIAFWPPDSGQAKAISKK